MARILFPFMGAILLIPFLPVSILFWSVFLLLNFSILIIWAFYPAKQKKYKYRWIGGFLITTQVFALAIFIQLYLNPLNKGNHYSKYPQSDSYLIEIKSVFTETKKSFKSIGEIKAVYNSEDSTWKNTSGRILLYFQKDSAFNLDYGQTFISRAKINPVQGAQNPNAFDYKKYLQLKGIHHQSYIRQNEWIIHDSVVKENLQLLAIKMRTILLEELEWLKFDKDSHALAAALLIGYDDYLDDDIRARFSGSGAMHILCVSGLHVGIIFMICNFLLGFLDKIKFGNFFRSILILLIIWLYALITGMAPSVMRASTMITFIILGTAFNKKGNSYNSMAASALLLLILDPNLVYNIGFQLSYAAVFAILFIQPKLFKIYKFRNPLLSKIWALITVSIAAQLGTFPLSVYYFHQFPNYFILTNLWVIPLSFLVVCGGILVLSLNILGFSNNILAAIITKIFRFSLIGLDNGVELINNFPWAVSDNLFFHKSQLILIYCLILMACGLFLFKQRIWFFSLGLTILMLSLNALFHKSEQIETHSWIVYKTTSSTAFDFISNQKSVLICDSSFMHNASMHKFVCAENHIKQGIKTKTILQSNKLQEKDLKIPKFMDNIFLFDSVRILWIDKKPIYKTHENLLNIDYVLISNSIEVDLAHLKTGYNFKMIIFDSSNIWWKIKQMKNDAKNLGIEFWDVNENGAFVYTKKPSDKNQRV